MSEAKLELAIQRYNPCSGPTKSGKNFFSIRRLR